MRAPPCSAREQELPRTGRATGAGGRRGHGRTAGCPAHRVPRERLAQLAVRAVLAQHEAEYLHLMQRRPPCSSSVSRRALARAEGGRQRPAQPHAGGLHAAADTAALSLCERMRTGVLAACHSQGSENSLARLSDRTSRGPARATPGRCSGPDALNTSTQKSLRLPRGPGRETRCSRSPVDEIHQRQELEPTARHRADPHARRGPRGPMQAWCRCRM